MSGYRRFKLVIAYDGTAYFGWQTQSNRRSVQETISKTFKKVFRCEPRLIGASRTDAGVHALGQVLLCVMPFEITPDKLRFAISNALPRDIVLRSVLPVDETFHPHHNVLKKTYYYHFFIKRPLPFFERYGWFFRYPIDLEKLKRILRIFEGTHDFRSFCTGTDHSGGTIRTIDAVNLEYFARFGVYRISFTAERFMRYMIRRLVGAAIVAAAKKEISEQAVRDLLVACNPRHTLLTAPAKGLILHKISYVHPGQEVGNCPVTSGERQEDE